RDRRREGTRQGLTPRPARHGPGRAADRRRTSRAAGWLPPPHPPPPSPPGSRRPPPVRASPRRAAGSRPVAPAARFASGHEKTPGAIAPGGFLGVYSLIRDFSEKNRIQVQ